MDVSWLSVSMTVSYTHLDVYKRQGVMVATWIETMNWVLASVLAMLVGLVLGLLNGLLVSKLRVAPFITTLGTMYFARGLAYWFTSAKTILWTNFRCV